MSSKALQTLGTILIEDVRDRTIDEFEEIFDGTHPDEHAAVIRESVQWTTDEQMHSIRFLIREAIDATLHNMLWALETRASTVQLKIVNDTEETNAVASSTGLAGELFGDSGWIARHSSHGSQETKEVAIASSAEIGGLTFDVHELFQNDKGFLLKGRCGEAEIRLGDRFKFITKAPIDGTTSPEALPLDFVLDGIFAYGRSLDYLCCGMSAKLQLVPVDENALPFNLVAKGQSRGRPGTVAPYQQRYQQKELPEK